MAWYTVTESDVSEVPFWKRRVLMAASTAVCFLTTGIIFGYSALYPVLVEEGAYAGLCPTSTTSFPCDAQTLRLTLMYTVGAFAISAAGPAVGLVLDRAGPRLCSSVGGVMLAAGVALFAAAAEVEDIFYMLGFLLLSLGGLFQFMAVMSFGELAGTHSSAFLGVLCGAFDGSSLILFGIAQLATHTSLSLSEVMWGYLAVPLVCLLIGIGFPDSAFFIPALSDSSPGGKGELDRVYRYTIGSQRYSSSGASDDDESTTLIEHPPDIFNASFRSQLTSLPYWMVTIVMGYLMLHINFYIASVEPQLKYIDNDSDRVSTFVSVFNLILPGAGVAMTPVVGWVLVRFGFTTSFVIICVSDLVWSVACLVPNIWVQLITFTFFSMSRPFVFAAMSAMIAELFGFANYGKLYGILRFFGAVCTLLQYPLTYLAVDVFNGDFMWTNVILLACSLLSFLFPLYLWRTLFYGNCIRPSSDPLEQN